MPRRNPGSKAPIPRKSVHRRRGSVPKLIWAALAALIVLTVLFLVPLGREIRAGQAISPLSAFVLMLIFQNVVMGILAPVLLQRR